MLQLLPGIMMEDPLRSPSPAEDPDSQFRVWFLLNTHHFRTIIKSEKCSGTIIKLGTFCTEQGTEVIEIVKHQGYSGF